MAKIAFVTDSTAYIPEELSHAYNITVVPLVLIWGDQNYRDGVDIRPDEFYTRLRTAKVMPTTSQVPVLEMQHAFQELIDRDFDVLGVFISDKLSGTFQSALQARQALGSAADKVALIDSNTTSMAMGYVLLAAARAAQQGAGLNDCAALAERAREHVGVYFVVDTLEFMHRGGRIGGATRFIGSALNLKPILALKDGRVEAEDRVRTKSKALERVLELVSEKVVGKTNIRVATVHANAEQEARELLQRASAHLGAIESILSPVSPVVGVHAGPGTVGLAFMADI
ncbi:MAG TPA: DegV family protein [Anaerolineales bacterium]|nr:DegV family protein [Anaerolineales bacterium]